MTEFIEAVRQQPFLQTALLTGVLSSVACGVVGSYVVVRRITYIAGGIAHCVLGGLGAARYLAVEHGWRYYHPLHGWAPLHPLIGAVVAALLAAVIIAVVSLRGRQREDTVIGALWAIGMATGVLFISKTSGYQVDLMSYLFGNIVFVSWDDVRLMALLDAVILGAVLVFHKRFLALCLDEEQAQLQGVDLLRTNIALLCVVALTVIVLTQVVGLILVIALLSLPAATAAHHVSRMGPLILASTGICAVLTTAPRMAAYGTAVTPEAAIVLAAAGLYLLSVLATRLRGRRGKD